MNAGRLGWALLLTGIAAFIAAYLLALFIAPTHPAVSWCAVYGVSAITAGILVIGALRNGRLTPHAAVASAAVFVIPLLGFGAALLLSPGTIPESLLFGLPRRAAVVLVGVGIVPFCILPLMYLRDQDPSPLDEDALEALRRETAALRKGEP